MRGNGCPRGNLEACGNSHRAKSLKNGFGVVRILTNASQNEIREDLKEADIRKKELKYVDPFHLTVIGFVRMNRREQAAFNVGFEVGRLERKFEDEVYEEAPRVALSVGLEKFDHVGNLVYANIYDPRIHLEQVQLAGQVALHGISPRRINPQTVPPHIAIGFDRTGDVEGMVEQVEDALSGTTVALQRWSVYPERYA